MSKLFALLFVAACSAAARPPAAPAPPHAELARSIDALSTEMLAKTPAVGTSVAVVWHGETIVERGYGLADLEAGTPATAESMFRVGSITKQFAAAAILQLVAQRKLALDDELTRYLPAYPTQGKHITIRQLLAHTAGIHDYEHGPWFVAHQAEHLPAADLVASFAAEPLDFEPGTRWSYSNSGYFLLGQIIELVAKQTFGDYVRDHELAPAGVRGVQYCPDEQTYPNAAKGYAVDGTGRSPAKPINMAYAFTAGAMCATAKGLVAWSRALSTGHVVDDRSWRAMTTPATLADGTKARYGFGLFVADLDTHPAVFHGGGINGFVSTLAYYPADDLYIAVLVNTEGSFADDLGEAIARLILKLPRAAVVDLPIDPAEAAAVAGTYELTGVATLVVEAEGAQLFVHADGDPQRARLQRQADASYAVPGSKAKLVFVRTAGRVTKLVYIDAGVALDGIRK